MTITGTNFTPTSDYVNFGGYGMPNLTATNATTLTFTVPPVGVGTYQVYVATNWGQSQPISFTVTAKPATSNSLVTITAPAGGESLTQGSQYTMKWNPNSQPSTVSLSLMQATASGNSYLYQIASGVPNNGSYVWTVPSNYSGSGFELYVSASGYLPVTSNLFSIVAK